MSGALPPGGGPSGSHRPRERGALDAPGGDLALAAGRFAVALPCGVGVAAGGVAVALHVLGHREVDGAVSPRRCRWRWRGRRSRRSCPGIPPAACPAAVVVAVVDHDVAPSAAARSSLGSVSLPDATASDRSSRSFLGLGEHR